MLHGRHFTLVISLIIAPLFLTPFTALSDQHCTSEIGKVVSVQGTVQIRKEGKPEWLQLERNGLFCKGDLIRTLPRSRASIVLKNGATIRLDQNSTMSFDGLSENKTFLLKLIEGAAHFFSTVPKSLKIATPFVNGAIEGTEFLVRVDSSQTVIVVFEGRMLASNNAGTIGLSAGKSIIAEKDLAPREQILVKPRDTVQWALYYPPVIDYSGIERFDLDGAVWGSKTNASIAAYRKGDIKNAFVHLAGLPDDLSDAHVYTYRAALLLAVGQVDNAREDIKRAFAIDKNNAHALAIQSIIALVQNDKNIALNLAEKAVSVKPDSPTGHVALSYARQASFDLQGALDSIQKAVLLDPDNALVHARLSELWLSMGYLKKALKAAQKAAVLNPDLERTQTVLGYAYLTQIKLKDSKKAFSKAIEMDQAAPLPRLGLGLATIRGGDLDSGRASIEIATSLDPNNSLIRSYLGKAYYDEKRNSKASNQYALAKQLDPNDPTPYFYDAIQKQTENRPVEALADLQKSIALNNNRAVYRSQLLLDEDLAARSAGLARIYKDLGFEQLALVEGWKSVNTDPGSYSAHRFLADSYAALPRHEIARVSELLQSQLFQPININPLQPSLAESNPFVYEGAGPSDPGYYELNSLFTRNRPALLASGVYGENETLGGEAVVSGVYNQFSASVGGLHYESEGFRENNDQNQNIVNAFAQWSVAHATSLQAEYRYADKEKGDLPLRFDPEAYFPSERNKENSDSIRLGLMHAFSPKSTFIASGIYEDTEYELDDPDFGLTFINKDKGYSVEAQQQLWMDRLDVIAGAGYYQLDRKATSIFEPFPADSTETDIDHTNLYGYTTIQFPMTVMWTLGASGDIFNGTSVDEDQFNPKIGAVWNPFSGTTIRGSIFRTLQRSLINSQTIEPTQVAGFNQFFDDAEGVDAWRYGIAADQHIADTLYGGLEFSMRDLNVPYESYSPPEFTPEAETAEWEERLSRAYLYWAPHDWIALSAEFIFEEFQRDTDFVGNELFTELKTYRAPLGINLYHPTGFSAQLKAAYVYQEGEFGDPFMGLSSEDDRFWVVDVALGYRLPKRLGMITIEGKNILDEEFNYQDTDPANPTIVPERLIIGKITLSF